MGGQALVENSTNFFLKPSLNDLKYHNEIFFQIKWYLGP